MFFTVNSVSLFCTSIWNLHRSRIAWEIGVHPSTVSSELRRNSNSNGKYVWCNAQAKADARKHGLQGNHRKPPELWWRIDQMIIEEDWSPVQIAGVLRKEGVHIVKQIIYNHVHADASGKLAPHMLHELKYTRRNKYFRPTKATNIANRTSIHQRPQEANGNRFGDWERYYCRLLRSRNFNPDRSFDKFHTYGKAAALA